MQGAYFAADTSSAPTEQEYRPDRTPAPMTFIVANTINGHISRRLLRVLLDSGGDRTMAHERILPRGCVLSLASRESKSTTIAGTFMSKCYVYLHEVVLPKFDRNKKIDGQGAFIFGGDCPYDLILGRDFLRKAGMKFDFERNTVTWMDVEVQMCYANGKIYDRVLDGADATYEQDPLEQADGFTTILDTEDESHSPEVVASKQTHLTPAQCKDIRRLVAKYLRLFSNKLRKYPHRQFSLEIEPGARPVHARPSRKS